MKQTIAFPSGTVDYYFKSKVEELSRICSNRDLILLTDVTIAALYPGLFAGRKHIIIPSGEDAKTAESIKEITKKLLELDATRKSMIVGIGGGVITDITGFVASVYMRGIKFGFVPTTLLAMVDAAIGGKNGVNVGLHKNILGTINQPEFILYDVKFLDTLPTPEWSNGFAEIIKYGCIFDSELFSELENYDLSFYKTSPEAVAELIATCAGWKNKTVAEDELETGIRKLLNFGHTSGHAIETIYHLPHGQAVAIGMVIACKLSSEINGFSTAGTERLTDLLERYSLPVKYHFSAPHIMEVLKMDKKRNNKNIDFILLSQIGEGYIQSLPLETIEQTLNTCM